MKCPKGRCIIATHLSGRIEDILPGYTGWMKERSGVAFGWQIFLTNNTYTVFGEEASNSGKMIARVCVCVSVCVSQWAGGLLFWLEHWLGLSISGWEGGGVTI